VKYNGAAIQVGDDSRLIEFVFNRHTLSSE